jgi:hypothetical protein
MVVRKLDKPREIPSHKRTKPEEDNMPDLNEAEESQNVFPYP